MAPPSEIKSLVRICFSKRTFWADIVRDRNVKGMISFERAAGIPMEINFYMEMEYKNYINNRWPLKNRFFFFLPHPIQPHCLALPGRPLRGYIFRHNPY